MSILNMLAFQQGLGGSTSSQRQGDREPQPEEYYHIRFYLEIPLLEEILHQLGCIQPYKSWVKLPTSWCRISTINCISGYAWSKFELWPVHQKAVEFNEEE